MRRGTVSVIGDSEVAESDARFALAREIGRLLIEEGFSVVTGGGTGVMDAASRGARESTSYKSGSVIAILPGFDSAEANPHADIVVPTGLGHLRNSIIAQSDAIIAIGGGAGTLAEIAFAWMYRRLIVALRTDGWSGRLADTRIDHRVRIASVPDDRVYGASTAAEAVEIVVRLINLYRG